MMVDTGNSSSSIRPQIARRLGLSPTYAVETVTAAGTRRVGALQLDAVQVAGVTQNSVEVMLADGLPMGVDGVLGQSFLRHHDYLLDYGHQRIAFDSTAPEGGIRLALTQSEARPAVWAQVNGERRLLVLDSGTPLVVLFGRTPRIEHLSLVTAAGSVAAEQTFAVIQIGSRSRRMDAALVPGGALQPGLLPLNVFSWVYVSNREGYAAFAK